MMPEALHEPAAAIAWPDRARLRADCNRVAGGAVLPLDAVVIRQV